MKETQDGSSPKRLYKFVGYAHLCEILTLSRLLASKPTSFNDPFDCRVKLHKPDIVRENSIQERIDTKARIVCFSKKAPDRNALMWSHYADSHKGACLEFDMPKWLDSPVDGVKLANACVLKAVKYEFNRPTLNPNSALYGQNTEVLDRLIFTKHKDWAYEEEWRMLFNLNRDIDWFIDFPLAALKCVYLGLRMSKPHKQTISKCLNKAGYTDTLIKEASENALRFGLDFHSYE